MRKLGQPFGLLLFTPVLALAQSSGQNYVKTETAYDLRGWLTNISTSTFTEDLFYADGPGTALYNGNISSIRWKDNTQSSKRGYKFSYDTANRLTSGAYGEGDALSLPRDCPLAGTKEMVVKILKYITDEEDIVFRVIHFFNDVLFNGF